MRRPIKPKSRTATTFRGMPAVRSAPREACLVVIAGPALGTLYELEGIMTIGRGTEADIYLEDDQSSRRHAHVRCHDDGRYCVYDLESLNGTEVNGAPLSADNSELKFGDQLRFGGRTVLLFTHRGPLERRAAAARQVEQLSHQGAAIARELSPLVGAIQSNLDYLSVMPPSSSLQDTEVRECIQDIDEATQRVSTQLERIGCFVGCVPERYEPVDVTELVGEVAELARARFPDSTNIELDISPNLAVMGARTALRALLMNLCQNARDAMSVGGTLTLRAEEASIAKLSGLSLPSAGRHAVLSVQDDGDGMVEETLNRAFEPFFTARRCGMGAGLGLAMVREVARLHRGVVTLESDQEGTTARVYLPLGAHKKGRDRLATAQGLTAPERGLGTRRVLLMDGDDVVAKAATRRLKHVGYEVTWVPNGLAAVDWCNRGRPPDVIILDRATPGLRTQDILSQIRALHPEIPILIASATQDGLPVWAESDAATTLLEKPWSSSSLERTVAAALKTQRPASLED